MVSTFESTEATDVSRAEILSEVAAVFTIISETIFIKKSSFWSAEASEPGIDIPGLFFEGGIMGRR
jgi:hypothetical protein